MLLKEVCKISANNYQKKDNWSYFNYLDTGSLTKNNIEGFQKFNSTKELPSRAKQKVEKDTILYSSVRPNQEHYGYIDKDYDNLLVSTGFIILEPTQSKVNPKYLYYYITQKRITDLLQGIAQNSTSSYPSITKDDLLDLEIDLPPRPIQDKIVEILSNIDSQIERNNTMVKTLQVLVQSTYSRWFNQFEFPNEDGLPYKSNGGKLVYNEELKREIPIGWEVKELEDLLIKNTTKYNGSTINTIDLSVMPSGSFSLMTLNSSDNFTTNLFEMKQGDLMFGSIRPYLKKAGIAPCNVAFAGTVHSYHTKNDYDYNLCLCALTNDDMFNYAIKNAKGTKMPVIASDDLLKYKVPYNKNIVKLFNDTLIIKDIVCNCVMQNIELNQLKSKLLPLLINGQLEV